MAFPNNHGASRGLSEHFTRSRYQGGELVQRSFRGTLRPLHLSLT